MDECGFFGLDGTIAEADLREAIRLAATAERARWFNADGAIDEQEDEQFGHLVRYWLASKADIWPTTLTFMQGKASDGSVTYGTLATGGPSDHDFETVRKALLLDAPDSDQPANLNELVECALRSAYETGQGNPKYPWSSVFVVACIRGTAIKLGLEGVSRGAHVGTAQLLLATEGHRFYVQEAYNRRFGATPKDGTYRAFCPTAASCPEHASCPEDRPVQVGDIIVQDRDEDITTMVQVEDFCNIKSSAFVGTNPLHGDIVVEVSGTSVVTIGGNLQSGSDANASPRFSVRRRRFPLKSNGTLAVKQAKLFTQEDNAEDLPLIPADDTGSDLDLKSTGRIFALLSPVETCMTVGKNSG